MRMAVENERNWFSPIFGWQENNLKTMHDHYDVYVNDDFIGEKVLVTPSESVEDIASYLRRCGFQGFDTNLDGDHYHIGAESEEVAEAIKGQLRAFLATR